MAIGRKDTTPLRTRHSMRLLSKAPGEELAMTRRVCGECSRGMPKKTAEKPMTCAKVAPASKLSR